MLSAHQSWRKRRDLLERNVFLSRDLSNDARDNNDRVDDAHDANHAHDDRKDDDDGVEDGRNYGLRRRRRPFQNQSFRNSSWAGRANDRRGGSDCRNGNRNRSGRRSLPNLPNNASNKIELYGRNRNENDAYNCNGNSNRGRHVLYDGRGFKRVYLTARTVRAIYREVRNLPLPATLANVAIALLNDNSTEGAMECHVQTLYSNPMHNGDCKNDDGQVREEEDDDIFHVYEISSTFNQMHLSSDVNNNISPQQTQQAKRVEFKQALHPLLAKGNNTMLYSWEEVQNALSEVFLFASLKAEEHKTSDVKMEGEIIVGGEEDEVVEVSGSGDEGEVVPESNENQSLTANQLSKFPTNFAPKMPSSLSKKQQQQLSSSKSPMKSPIKASKGSLHKQFQQSLSSSSRSMKQPKSSLSLSAYKRHIRNQMGDNKYLQIFRHSLIRTSKPSIASQSEQSAQLGQSGHASIDLAARRLDERIRRKEESITHPICTSARHDAILLQKQKEAEERARIEAEIRNEKERLELKQRQEKQQKEREAQRAASNLLRPLTDEEKRIVQKAMYGIGPENEILASHDADSVQRGSMQRLQPATWLNDEIINYFLKNCLAQRDENMCAHSTHAKGATTNNGTKRKRSHFFNSFFMQSLFDEKNFNPSKRGKYNYSNVKRWSKKVPGKDIFNLRYIVCPINLDNAHWTCAVIFMEDKKICYYDSLGGTDWTKLEGLLEYLKDEHKSKKGREMEDVEEWELVGCDRKVVPQQKNGYDCGVFICMFCDFISKDCPLLFSQEHINQCRERIALSIMKNCAIE